MRRPLPVLSATGPECLSAHPVHDDRFAPQLRRGDLLIPVSCRERRPRFGDYVLVRNDAAPRHELLRFVARTRDGRVIAWTGSRYARVSPESVRARILSARRDGRLYDLAVAPGFPGRDRIAGLLHRILAGLSAALSASAAPRGTDRL